MKKKILVIDVGGTHVKLMISRTEKQKFGSGSRMTPREMVTQMKPLLTEWNFDAVSIGFPSPVRDGRILSDPKHLGKGWDGVDFEKALGKPGLADLGEKTWQRDVEHALVQLKKSLIADYVVLGGGNAKKLDELPEGVERGHNRNAFLGGTRLWQIDSRTRRPKWQIL